MTSDTPRRLLGHSIAATLEERILLGEIAAGSKLDETSLARDFDVSRTPVREALQIVVSRGLAVRMPYKGVVVSDITRDRIDDLFEAMGEIEALCGRFSAQRMSMEERAVLLGLHETMSDLALQGGAEAYEAANTRFHQAIYAGSHNSDFVEMAEAMRLKLSPFRRSQLADRARIEHSNAEHAQIVEAIIERDGQAAEKALRRHLLSAAQTMLEKWTQTRPEVSSTRSRAS
ncbi:GntR family transcriptional regulator [Maritalea mobilis]|uniref:GntR family transcriptional regulator n=1 Tax=Maritalea mobilis TaxID=483324 RepID=UPI001C98BBCF|nr:GntR family transcriptional regulator [Maritalea mobilis]MBY6200552.1 GntR family transcriptional regulator [Maritalea mobilis]